MEWRTATTFRTVMIFGAFAVSAPVFSAGIEQAEDAYPVSRFGAHSVRPSEQVRDDEGDSDGLAYTDRMPASAAAATQSPSAGSRGEGAPLGSLRRNGVQEVAIIAGDLGFFPRTVFVTRDIPVRMFVTGASKSTLCIMMDSFSVRKQVRSQRIEELSFTPATAGKFRFYCPVNGAEGYLVVREFARSEDQ